MPAAAEPAGQEVIVYPSFLHCCTVLISKLVHQNRLDVPLVVAAGGAAAGTGRRAFVVKAFVAAVPETDETDAGGFISIS